MAGAVSLLVLYLSAPSSGSGLLYSLRGYAGEGGGAGKDPTRGEGGGVKGTGGDGMGGGRRGGGVVGGDIPWERDRIGLDGMVDRVLLFSPASVLLETL